MQEYQRYQASSSKRPANEPALAASTPKQQFVAGPQQGEAFCRQIPAKLLSKTP
jgi:hypothetical protein